MGDKGQVKFLSTPVHGGCLVQISGHINEFFNRQDLISAISGSTVVFDLDNVKRITSFGVKQWLQAFRDFWVEYYTFINCRPSIMSQFNMVSHFGGVGQIVTFYAPYFCQSCDTEVDVLIDLRAQYEEIKKGNPPQARCPSCQEPLEFDDSPESYFSYVSGCPPPVVPRLAAQLIDGEDPETILPEASKEKEHFRVKKDIGERVTGLWMSGPLQTKNQFRRLLDALEGSVVIIAAEITEVTREGMEALRAFLEATGIQFYFARVPNVLWEALSTIDPYEGNTRIVSLWLKGVCSRCRESFEIEADQKLIKEASGRGFLMATCTHCQTSTRASFVVPEAIRERLADSLPPEVTQYLQKRSGRSPDSSPGNTAWPSIYEKPSGAMPGRVIQRCLRCQSFYPAEVALCPNDGEKTVPLVHDSRKESFVGKFIGSYQITEKRGEGGMGSVYAAQHPALGKKIAIKFLRPKHAQQEALVERLFAEAKAASQVGNDHIIDVQDFGKLDDRFPYIMMEFLEGEPLSALLKRETKLNPRVALSLIFQLLDGLAAAHEKGIIHRDLKPDNIFLIERGQQEHFVKLLDFGIAKLVDSNTPITMIGMIMGTPHYMPPEQAEGKISDVDARSDLYAMGVILFQMLCGRLPFIASNATELMVAHITTPPPAPRSLNPNLSPALEAAILMALAKAPPERFQSAEEMLKTLQAAPEARGIQFKLTSSKKISALPGLVAASPPEGDEMLTILEALPPDDVLDDLNTIAVPMSAVEKLPQPTTRPIRPIKLSQNVIKVPPKSKPAVPTASLPRPPAPSHPKKEVFREMSAPLSSPQHVPTPPVLPPRFSPPPAPPRRTPAPPQNPPPQKRPQISVIPPLLDESLPGAAVMPHQESPLSYAPEQPGLAGPPMASAPLSPPQQPPVMAPFPNIPQAPAPGKLFWVLIPLLFALLGGAITTVLILTGVL